MVSKRSAKSTHRITLNREDSKAFVEALLNPPEPNAALRKASNSKFRPQPTHQSPVGTARLARNS
jgi:uncharacterized protein (DUF1778 family)